MPNEMKLCKYSTLFWAASKPFRHSIKLQKQNIFCQSIMFLKTAIHWILFQYRIGFWSYKSKSCEMLHFRHFCTSRHNRFRTIFDFTPDFSSSCSWVVNLTRFWSICVAFSEWFEALFWGIFSDSYGGGSTRGFELGIIWHNWKLVGVEWYEGGSEARPSASWELK